MNQEVWATKILKKTSKAMLIENKTGRYWIPYSVITNSEEIHGRLYHMTIATKKALRIEVAQWWYEQVYVPIRDASQPNKNHVDFQGGVVGEELEK